jgi:hypothetical protein
LGGVLRSAARILALAGRAVVGALVFMPTVTDVCMQISGVGCNFSAMDVTYLACKGSPDLLDMLANGGRGKKEEWESYLICVLSVRPCVRASKKMSMIECPDIKVE